MGETADQVRQEIDGKRDEAAHKIDEIEQRMNDTVHKVQEGVQQTTEQVKTTVQDSIQGAQDAVGQTAQQVTDQVKQTTEQVKANMDWRKQVEERPLVMVGAAFLGGFVLGSLTGGDDDGQRGHHAPDSPGYSYGGPLYGSQMGASSQRPHQPSQAKGMGATSAMGGAGMMAGLKGMIQQSGLQDTLTNSATAFVNSFGDKIRTTLEEQVPGFKEQMQKQQQSGQSSQSQPARSDTSGQSGQSGSMGQQTEVASSDATGRTAPYYGAQESRPGSGGAAASQTPS